MSLNQTPPNRTIKNGDRGGSFPTAMAGNVPVNAPNRGPGGDMRGGSVDLAYRDEHPPVPNSRRVMIGGSRDSI